MGTAHHQPLLDGANYPPCARFPAIPNAEARVSSAPDRSSSVSPWCRPRPPVLLSLSADGLVVEAGGTEEARASEAMEATFTGDPLTVGFNSQYLIDGLTNLGAQVAVLQFVDAFKPAVISPAGEDGDVIPGYRYLIMPIRVSR